MMPHSIVAAKRWVVLCLIAAVVAGGFLSRRGGAGQEVQGGMQKATLWIVSNRDANDLRVSVGDVIQFIPFPTPTTSKFLDASLELKLDGDVTLEPIGITDVTGQDGKSAKAYFLLVRQPGVSSVKLNLVDQQKAPMANYAAKYTVHSEAKEAF